VQFGVFQHIQLCFVWFGVFQLPFFGVLEDVDFLFSCLLGSVALS
jgi:hypothetical protein